MVYFANFSFYNSRFLRVANSSNQPIQMKSTVTCSTDQSKVKRFRFESSKAQFSRSVIYSLTNWCQNQFDTNFRQLYFQHELSTWKAINFFRVKFATRIRFQWFDILRADESSTTLTSLSEVIQMPSRHVSLTSPLKTTYLVKSPLDNDNFRDEPSW